MIIRPYTINYKKLQEIPPGSVFKTGNDYYLKIELITEGNCVKLTDGSARHFSKDLPVTPVKGEFIITKET